MSNTTTTQNIPMGMTQGIGMANTSKIKKYKQVNRLCRVKGLGGGIADMILDSIASGLNVRDRVHTQAGALEGVSAYNNAFTEELKILGWFYVLKHKKTKNEIEFRHILVEMSLNICRVEMFTVESAKEFIVFWKSILVKLLLF